MSRDAILFWAFIAGIVAVFVLIVLGSNSSNTITDERGCQVQSYSDNRIFGEDSHTVQTYCPVEVNND